MVVGVFPKEKVPPETVAGAGLTSGVDFAGVPKLKVESASLGVVVAAAAVVVIVEVPKENPASAALDLTGSGGFCAGGSILPRPASLMGLLISAEIPVIFGSCDDAGSSGFFASTGLDDGASTVSLAVKVGLAGEGLITFTSSS